MEQTSGKVEISCGVIPPGEALCLLKQLWEIPTCLHSFITKARQIFLYSCNFHHRKKEYSLSEEAKSIQGFGFVLNKRYSPFKKKNLRWSWSSWALVMHLTPPRRTERASVTLKTSSGSQCLVLRRGSPDTPWARTHISCLPSIRLSIRLSSDGK